MLQEILDLGFERVELGHGIRLSLMEGIQRRFNKGGLTISSLHNFCPLPIEITRAAVLKALQTLDANFDKAGAAVAVAKARAGSTATLAVQEGVQMHGGMGMTDQFDIGFFMKRARVCQELFGDNNFHADQLAKMKSY